jgi:Uma2 family endonuclease
MASRDQSLDDPQFSDFKVSSPERMSEDEFVAWCNEDTHAEWIDGDVVMMTPANYEHTLTCHWLASVMSSFAEHHDLGVVLPDFRVRLRKQRRHRSPDIAFVSKDRMRILEPTHVEGAPDLVVEIVSPDSVARDWREKYLEYEAAGVREYWVIDPMARRAEVYALTDDRAAEAQPSTTARYRRVEEKDGVVASTVLPGFALRVAWLWPTTRPKALEALKQLGVLGPSDK